MLPRDQHGTPYLQLAPMEGVGDRCFRKALVAIGGFDEAVCDFIRVPRSPHIPTLAKKYDPKELCSIPLAAQLMGSEAEPMAEMARYLEHMGAPRIDINCGCPSNTVTGRGAGSSLLKEPRFLYEIAKAVVQAVSIPVTVKMRSGFADLSLFEENLVAAQASGIQYITLHPRTKVDGYTPPARWDLIARAKQLLQIPLVGNGDIVSVEDAVRMLKLTQCDGLMIGRGSLINPFLFQEIRAHFGKKVYEKRWEDLVHYLQSYLALLPHEMLCKTKIGKMKQLLGFLFKANSQLLSVRHLILTAQHRELDTYMTYALTLLREGQYLSC